MTQLGSTASGSQKFPRAAPRKPVRAKSIVPEQFDAAQRYRWTDIEPPSPRFSIWTSQAPSNSPATVPRTASQLPGDSLLSWRKMFVVGTVQNPQCLDLPVGKVRRFSQPWRSAPLRLGDDKEHRPKPHVRLGGGSNKFRVFIRAKGDRRAGIRLPHRTRFNHWRESRPDL